MLAVFARYFCSAAPEYFMPNKVDVRRDEIIFVIHCKLWMHLTMLYFYLYNIEIYNDKFEIGQTQYHFFISRLKTHISASVTLIFQQKYTCTCFEHDYTFNTMLCLYQHTNLTEYFI